MLDLEQDSSRLNVRSDFLRHLSISKLRKCPWCLDGTNLVTFLELDGIFPLFKYLYEMSGYIFIFLIRKSKSSSDIKTVSHMT